ncbi:hypothetical protein A5882_003164, partial [Enterococcus sp. 4E1_DIV0656]
YVSLSRIEWTILMKEYFSHKMTNMLEQVIW